MASMDPNSPASLGGSQPPTPQREGRPKTLWPVIVFIWIVIGALWCVAQFVVSEGAYRLGNSTGSEFAEVLYNLSDLAAWPAGEVYDQVKGEVYVTTIRESLQSTDLDFGEDEKVALEGLLVQYQDDFGNLELESEIDDILMEKDIYPEVSTAAEYLIYGGTCICWGLLVAIVGSGVTLLIRAAKSKPSEAI